MTWEEVLARAHAGARARGLAATGGLHPESHDSVSSVSLWPSPLPRAQDETFLCVLCASVALPVAAGAGGDHYG
jgi:hypothetical protein